MDTADTTTKPGPVMMALSRMIGADRPDEILTLAARLSEAHPALTERVLAQATRSLPHNFDLFEAFCISAERRGDEMVAYNRWRRARREYADRIEAHRAFVAAMLRQNRTSDAALAIKHALLFFGQTIELCEIQARVAEAQEQWPEAAAFWAKIAEQHPDHPTAAAQAEAARRRHEEAATRELSPAAAIERLDITRNDDLRQLVTGFESLGYNCEFGLMQRYFGAEPLGLMRFSFSLVPTVLSLLRTRFDSVGEPAAMSLRENGREFMLRHEPSNWAMHTRIQIKPDVDTDKLFRDQCRHAGFLRKKLMKDLTEQKKIFVYWRGDLDEEGIAEIDAAVQAYGPNRLMCVRLCDDTHPPGTIEWRGDGLMVAALDRPGNAFPGAPWTISMKYWIHFCRAARERWGAPAHAAPAAGP